jgi:hypothetical protein
MSTRTRALTFVFSALALASQAHAGDRPPSTGSGGSNQRPSSTGEACNNAASESAQLFITAPARFTELDAASNWSGIDTLYRSLDDKVRPGTTFCVMTGMYHMAGGKAALSRGENGVARVRFLRATTTQAPGAQASLVGIDTSFAPVNIEPQPGTQELTLTRPAHMALTDPIAISAFTRAKVALQNNRKFNGWLPLGAYTIEPLHKSFVVVPNPNNPLVVH